MAKTNRVAKPNGIRQAFPKDLAVKVEHPREDEHLTSSTYTFQIGALPSAQRVEISIDSGDWKPCRESLGLWWYDWADYAKGAHIIVARTRIGDDVVATSAPRRFTVA